MTEFNFSKFDPQTVSEAKKPELTIRAKGGLVLNKPAYQLMGEPTAVELLYDEGQTVIGLRTAPADAHGAHRLRTISKGERHVVSGAAFLRHFEIPFGDPVKREVQMSGDILVVDLKDPGKDAQTNRKRERLEDAAKRLVDELDKARQRRRPRSKSQPPAPQ